MTAIAEEPTRARSLRIVLEAAVVVVFLLLVWSNYKLRQDQQREAGAAKSRRGFVVKDHISTIPTLDLTGQRSELDLSQGRKIVAIIDPRCESCRELIQTLRGTKDVHILSVATPEETSHVARGFGLASMTRSIAKPLPEKIEGQLHIYPQLFVVDHGQVVRTCVKLSECR
ncbi:MAG: hypothetical protein ACLGH0_10520 [Thermoanaerobaculia bacterium]